MNQLFFRGILLIVFLIFTLGVLSAHAGEVGPPKDRKYYEQNFGVIWDKPMHKKWIALTFDDGPNAKITKDVLHVLQQYQVKATFFCLGYKVKRYPEIAQLIVSQGHEIANHTYSHPSLNQISNRELDKEIKMTQKVIFQTTGIFAHLFRPPEGIYNDQILKVAKKNQLQSVMWSWDQDTKDWSRNRMKSTIVKKVLKNASNGDIILFHDSQKKTVQALKEILPELKKQGYQFVTVTQLLQAK